MKKSYRYLKTLSLITLGLSLASCSSSSKHQITITPNKEANVVDKENKEEENTSTNPIENDTSNNSNEANTSINNDENNSSDKEENNTTTNNPDQNNNSNNQEQTPIVENVYKINYSSATVTMGQSLQLNITNNGVKVSNITWSSSDTDCARVTEDGLVRACFFTSTNETVTITGKINNNKSLTCSLTINPRTDTIFQNCYYHAQAVSQDDDGHVVYMFIHAGTEANGTIYVNKTFEYDSFTNVCRIKVQKSYEESVAWAYYIGCNDFFWGDYKNGLFYGQYSEVYNNVEKDALFSFENIGFSYSEHTIYLTSQTTYTIKESDWSSINDEALVAEGVFYRVQECSEFAEEKFTEYNFGIHLF